ncbi:MAG: hypothetical protein IID38_01890 [Planctomycetes bacterium]|nr:hypothetical protein [Planctomycetota bacterium]MCH7884019.1 hypothetical protein [Planctomycetota bacterium]
MRSTRFSKYGQAATSLLLAGYVVLGAACEASDLQAVAAGLEAAAGQLQGRDLNQSHDDDLTFGEWLLSELDD